MIHQGMTTISTPKQSGFQKKKKKTELSGDKAVNFKSPWYDKQPFLGPMILFPIKRPKRLYNV